jgi:hypothetical protein
MTGRWCAKTTAAQRHAQARNVVPSRHGAGSTGRFISRLRPAPMPLIAAVTAMNATNSMTGGTSTADNRDFATFIRVTVLKFPRPILT